MGSARRALALHTRDEENARSVSRALPLPRTRFCSPEKRQKIRRVLQANVMSSEKW